MNPIPDDDEIESFLHAIFRDSNGNEIFPAESELEKLDKKYAPLFEKLEGKE